METSETNNDMVGNAIVPVSSKFIATEVETVETKKLTDAEVELRKNLEAKAYTKLTSIFAGMLAVNVFYARIMYNFKRISEWAPIKTLGIRIEQGKVVFWFHPEYILGAGNFELMDRIEHECLHLLNNHPKRTMGLLGVSSFRAAKEKLKTDKSARDAVNLATDFAVNYELYMQKNKSKPLEGTWPLASDPEYNLDMNLAMEAYYELLRRNPPQMNPNGKPQQEEQEGVSKSGKGKSKGKGKGKGNEQPSSSMQDQLDKIAQENNWFGDNHDEDQTTCDMDSMDSQIKAALRRAAMEQNRNRGTIPGRYQQLIDDMFKSPEIPWNVLLRKKVHSALMNTRKPCYYKPKKQRLFLLDEGIDTCVYPSHKKDFGYTILFAIDTSGSMSDDALKTAARELLALAEQFPGSRILVIQCDAAIEKEYELTCEEDVLKAKRGCEFSSFSGRGGTSFDPPFARFRAGDKVNNQIYAADEVYQSRIREFPRKVDAFIYFTDGFAPAPNKSLDPKCAIIWVFTPEHSKDVLSSFGGTSLVIKDIEHA